jgi:Zn-finger nucleic acid-binding protein
MDCPVCKVELVNVSVGKVLIDACLNGCGGLWFDQMELRKFDEPHEAFDEKLLKLENTRPQSIRPKKLRCPRCETIVMMRHFFSIKRNVEVDECAQCGGVWLDAGELDAIRSEFTSESAKLAAAENYFAARFDEDLKAARKESEASYEWTRQIAHLLRFISPSYYLPAKSKNSHT